MRKGENIRKIFFSILMAICFGVYPAGADIVELNLFDLGCPIEFNWDTQNWQTDFDLGVEFVEISSVYMDWSGEITAGLATNLLKPGPQPFPLDVFICAYLDIPIRAGTSVQGGGDTYPVPEPFDHQSDFKLWGSWSGLMDGQATIWLYYNELVGPYLTYVESGLVYLERVTLVVDGVIVPEPASLLLLSLGGFLLRKKR